MNMKVAISIPDRVFQAAERISKRMRISRSQLYAQAVEAYIHSQSGDEITAQLNKVYSKTSSRPEPGVEAATLEVLRREPWE